MVKVSCTFFAYEKFPAAEFDWLFDLLAVIRFIPAEIRKIWN